MTQVKSYPNVLTKYQMKAYLFTYLYAMSSDDMDTYVDENYESLLTTIPSNFKTWRKIIKQSPEQLQTLAYQPPELCFHALKKDARNIRYIHNPTDDMIDSITSSYFWSGVAFGTVILSVGIMIIAEYMK